MPAPQPDPAGPSDMDTVAPSGCKTWVDICFEHLCLQGLVDFVFLIRWCRVSREWMDALKRAVRLMQQVSLPGGVTGEEALRALGLVAGGNVRFLRLRQCRNLIPGDIEEILHRLQATCLAVMEVDVTGCRDDVILRALSVRTISMVGGSPLDVPAQLKGLAPGSAHCPLPAFLNALELLPPRLVFGQKIKMPTNEGFLKLAAKACIACNATSVAELALLLGLAFPVRNPGETRVFDCNKRGPRGDTALMLACRAGLLVLATMLMDAGADVSVANEQDDTALLLACQAGNLELATRLKDAGANVSAANKQGETPLLVAVAIGNLVLAELLVSWGADVKAQRRDGAGLIALAIHSKRPDSISFALRHGPKRIASQSTFDARAFLAQAYASPRNIQQWLLAGASPRTLALEIGALLLHPEADAGRLDDMRALLHRHKELLQDTAKWPVPHAVEQLAAQDLGASVQHDETDGSGESMCRLIECIKPSSATGEYGRLVNAKACRWSIEGDNAVRSVAFSPDMLKLARGEGNDAIVCCAVSGLEFRRLVGHRKDNKDCTCEFWLNGTFKEANPACPVQGHSLPVAGIDWSIDGLLASCSYDKTVKLWDPSSSGECLKTLEGHRSTVSACVFAPHGKTIVSASWDSTLKICDVELGTCLTTLKGHSGIVWACKFSPKGDTIVSGSEDRTLKIWDVALGTCKATLEGHSGIVRTVAFSCDGVVASGGDDRKIILWDAQKGERLMELNGHINAVAFSFDGKVLASGGHDRKIILWDPNKGERLTELKGHSSQVNGVSFSADGSLVASCSGNIGFGDFGGSGDCSVRMWSVETGQELKKILGHSNGVLTVAWSKAGLLASGSADDTVKIWNSSTGEYLNTLEGHSDWVYCVQFNPTDPSQLVSGSRDTTIKVWNVSDGKCLQTLTGHSYGVTCVQFNPRDAGELVSGSNDNTVRLWSVADGKCERTFTGHRSPVQKVEFSQDGATLVSSDDSETLTWDVATGARKDKVAGQLAFTKATNGRYIVKHAQKDDLIFVYDTRGGVVNADGEGKVPIAFFRAPSPVVSVCCAGDKVAVVCQSGAVLKLHAAWLTDGGAA